MFSDILSVPVLTAFNVACEQAPVGDRPPPPLSLRSFSPFVIFALSATREPVHTLLTMHMLDHVRSRALVKREGKKDLVTAEGSLFSHA